VNRYSEKKQRYLIVVWYNEKKKVTRIWYGALP